MRRALFLIVVLSVCIPNDLSATPKADSIVAFTGARTKLVWKRLPWCNDSYQPQSQSYMTANQSLMFFDTDVGTEQTLDRNLADIQFMRISRSGKWLTWNDVVNKRTYIMDLTAATPATTVLLDNATTSYWCVRAFWVDQTTGTEYLYCLDNYTTSGNGIYKLPLKADGTADKSNAVRIYSAASIDDAISVSRDGQKVGAAIPWPTTGLIDVASGRFDVRHEGSFGCQANLSPDNSYRFFHCLDEHQGVRMYDANMSTTNWTIDFLATAPGWTCTEGNTDFAAPRWTNNPQFISNTYPLINGYLDGDCPCWGGIDIWSLNAAGVQSQVRQDLIDNFFLAKFSSDFRTIEKTLMIASDLRYFQYGGDAWMANGITGSSTTSQPRNLRMDHSPTDMLTQRDGSVVIHGAGEVRLTDAQGRLVQRWNDGHAASINTRDLRPGVYTVSRGNQACRVTVTR